MTTRHKRRSSRRNRSRSKAPQLGKWAKLLSVPVVALAGVAVALGFTNGIEQPSGYCYAREDQHQAVVFVDASMTAESSPTQVRDYRTAFIRAYENAPANALISLFTTATDGRGSVPTPVFSMCKPASTPQEQKQFHGPSKTAAYLTRQTGEAKAEYLAEVEKLLSDAQDPEKAAGDSPILEQVQAISRYKGFQSSNRSLTWISDGIQNSEIARFCSVQGHMPRYQAFEKTRAYKDTKPNDFAGTDVSVLLVEFSPLPNDWAKYCSNAELRDWWPAYFKGNGADSAELTRLRFWAGE